MAVGVGVGVGAIAGAAALAARLPNPLSLARPPATAAFANGCAETAVVDTMGSVDERLAASVATPTGGTCGIDFSQQDAAEATATDFGSVGSSSTLTSASAPFRQSMVGNIFHQTTTGTGAFGIVGWYEIVSYTSTSQVTLDRTPNSGTASVACTGFIGGAARLDGLEDAFLEAWPVGAIGWAVSGTHTLSAVVNIASTNATSTLPQWLIGYTTKRGDTCNGANRATLALGANACTFAP